VVLTFEVWIRVAKPAPGFADRKVITTA
jgi:hypothetical protein